MPPTSPNRDEFRRLLVAQGDPGESLGAISAQASADVVRRRLIGAFALTALVAAIAVAWVTPTGGDTRSLRRLSSATELTVQELDFVRHAAFDQRSARDRRLALSILARHRVRVPSPLVESLLAGDEASESLESPEELAGPGGDTEARRIKHAKTLTAALNLLYVNAVRYADYAAPSRVEPLAVHPNEQVRLFACRVLGEIPGYHLPDDLRAAILTDRESVRTAAKKLLTR